MFSAPPPPPPHYESLVSPPTFKVTPRALARLIHFHIWYLWMTAAEIQFSFDEKSPNGRVKLKTVVSSLRTFIAFKNVILEHNCIKWSASTVGREGADNGTVLCSGIIRARFHFLFGFYSLFK